VADLTTNTTDMDLEEVFGQFGMVVRALVFSRDGQHGKCGGVSFATLEEAANASDAQVFVKGNRVSDIDAIWLLPLKLKSKVTYTDSFSCLSYCLNAYFRFG